MEIYGIPTPPVPPKDICYCWKLQHLSIGGIFWCTCLDVSPSIWLCLTSLRSSAMGKTVKCFQNMFWKEATKRRNSLPKISHLPIPVLSSLFVLNNWKLQTLKPKCGPHLMAWHEEFHLEGQTQSNEGSQGLRWRQMMAKGVMVAGWVIGILVLITPFSFRFSCPNPNLALSPAASCKQLPLFSGNNLDPYPPMCFVLFYLSDSRVLTLSLHWSLF